MNVFAVPLFIVVSNSSPSLLSTLAFATAAVVLLGTSIAAIRAMRRTGRTGTIAVALAIALGLLACSAAVSSNRLGREQKYSIKCSSHLRQIGIAALQYRGDHARWPGSLDDLKPLLKSGELSCPFEAPGLPYYYIAPKEVHPEPKVVIAFELPSHLNAMNLLLSDGSVHSLSDKRALRALAELATGQNPPPSMSTK